MTPATPGRPGTARSDQHHERSPYGHQESIRTGSPHDCRWPSRLGPLRPRRRRYRVPVLQPCLAGAWQHLPGVGRCSVPAQALAPCFAHRCAAWSSPVLLIGAGSCRGKSVTSGRFLAPSEPSCPVVGEFLQACLDNRDSRIYHLPAAREHFMGGGTFGRDPRRDERTCAALPGERQDGHFSRRVLTWTLR